MSGLGHLLEREGIATVAIALVREHALAMRPPRALWVPFPLGRPFGVPGDAPFQRRVLLAALALLDRTDGPVLVDFPDEAPQEGAHADDTAPVCPVSFPAPPAESGLLGAVLAEIERLRPWYDLGRERRGRTTVGLSGLGVDAAARLLAGWVDDGAPVLPAGVGLVDALRWAGEDLKAFHLEAVTAQPGGADGERLEHWFWTATSAARLLVAARKRCLADADAAVRDVGGFMLVAAAYRD